MSAKVISFINLKGGVGKTTLALATGEILANEKQYYPSVRSFYHKYKVLFIDLDGQSNLTYSTLSENEIRSCWGSEKSTYNFFTSCLEHPIHLKECICKGCSNVSDIRFYIDIIPSSFELFDFEERVMEAYENGSTIDLSALRMALKRALGADVFLFNWNNIPGSDSEKLLTCLKDDHYERWVEGAEIHKSDDGKTVHICKGENSAEIMIDENGKDVTVKCSTRTYNYNFKVKREYGKLNIYGESILEKYDYIIIDCPPNLSILTANAIIASDYYVVPVIPEKLSTFGLELIKRRIAGLKEIYSDDIKIKYAGAVLNRVDIRRNSHIELAEQIIEDDNFKCFNNWIGDVKPLYIVADYSLRRYANCHQKYGGWSRRKNPSKSELLYERGKGRTPDQIRTYERISGFVEELVERAN